MAINESTEFNEYDLNESAAADTLKPGAGSVAGDVGKTELMASVVSAMGGMSKDEINKFQEVLNQYGKNKIPGAEDKSAANAATIAAKGAMKEDVEQMFAGDDLSEEFREKASTLFEAAVNARVGLEAARLEEEYEARLEEEVADIQEAMTEKLDQYLDYVVEQWMEENKLAIESATKVAAADKLVEGIRELFAEHNIEIPEEEIDIVEDMEARIAELEDRLNEEISEKIELSKIIEAAEMEAIFDEVSEGLAETQVEKLRALAEGLEFTDSDNYRKKMELVKENYFTNKKTISTDIVTEETTSSSMSDLVEETNLAVQPEMSQYVSAIARSAKK